MNRYSTRAPMRVGTCQQAQFLERRADAGLELRGELEHMPIGVLRHHFGTKVARIAASCTRCRPGAAKAEMVDRLPRSEVRQYRPDPLRLCLAASPDGAGNAAGDAFAEDEEVRLEAMRAAIAGGPQGDGVVSSMISATSWRRVMFAQAGVEAFGRRDHADVGHEGFGEHRGDVAMGGAASSASRSLNSTRRVVASWRTPLG